MQKREGAPRYDKVTGLAVSGSQCQGGRQVVEDRSGSARKTGCALVFKSQECFPTCFTERQERVGRTGRYH